MKINFPKNFDLNMVFNHCDLNLTEGSKWQIVNTIATKNPEELIEIIEGSLSLFCIFKRTLEVYVQRRGVTIDLMEYPAEVVERDFLSSKNNHSYYIYTDTVAIK